MKQKFKSLSRTTQLAIIIAIALSIGIVAYAAINAWISKSWQSELTKGSVMEMELNQASVSGEIVPGGSIAVSPTIKNTGTKQCLAFVKVEMPTYGSGTPAYTFTADSNWTKVADNGGTVVFGYSDILNPDDETATALCENFTMVQMSGSEFLSIDDVNVKLTGYLSAVDEYGEDPATAWSQIGE